MNKFSCYFKIGMNPKGGVYKIGKFINPLLDELSTFSYTKDIDLQFHFEIRVDTKEHQWGDEEGASKVKLFLKKELIGASITVKDEKINNQQDYFSYLNTYFNDALKLIIARLEKQKIKIDDEKLISDFNRLFKIHFKTI